MQRVVPLKDKDGSWHAEPNMWYRCLSCEGTVPASPSDSVSCRCGNIEIDFWAARLDIADERLVEAFVDDER